ncbi:MAG: chemotaxis protein CheW [Telluria sp.]
MNAPGAKLDPAGRRTRLREYQAQLLEHMQAARTASSARVHQLGIHIGPRDGGADFLLELSQSGEIVPLPPTITAVPLTHPWYLGLANLRGNLVGIVDLARYLGLGETPVNADARLVNFAPTLGFNCALLVSRVYGLRQAVEMQAVGEHLLDADNRQWVPLDLRALTQEARFLHVGL